MITRLFNFVAIKLFHLAKSLHLTYNEINIIVYYFIIPLTWCIMLDLIIKKPICTPFWTILCLIVYLVKKKNFSGWCDWFFMKSADFLNSFHLLGWNYEKASVIICVVVPIIIYIILGILFYSLF